MWQQSKVSCDERYHEINQVPLYSKRFTQVLKFHEPGLAPVREENCAYHINLKAQPAYESRFLRTFGFYEGVAAVQSLEGCFHILPNGEPIYSAIFAWCGNFQEGFCSVRDTEGNYFHIDHTGAKPYSFMFSYVGDFHDGFATVQNKEGLYTHISDKGVFLHGKWFLDLDVYHKGFARAKDRSGWFHIDKKGEALYLERYAQIEPFYNSVARVESFQGAIFLLSEQGEILLTVREKTQDLFHTVSAELVSYWRFYTLKAAQEINLFKYLPNRFENLLKATTLPEASLRKLLMALYEMEFVTSLDHDIWILTEKGKFLDPDHPFSLAPAFEVWKDEHLVSWQHLLYSLFSEKPAFDHLFKQNYFTWLQTQSVKNTTYHQAIATYAKKDYTQFCTVIDFSSHHVVVDAGGSLGLLLIEVLEKNSHLQGYLIDLPHVVELAHVPQKLQNRLELKGADFFEKWPLSLVDAIIFSRVLHDWSDEKVLQILIRAAEALSFDPSSRIYVIENCFDDTTASGSLLNLNMLVMTTGKERTEDQFKALFYQASLEIESIVPLNESLRVFVLRIRSNRPHANHVMQEV